LAAAAELKRLGLNPDDLLWIGAAGEMEEQLVRRAGLRLETIRGGAIVGVGFKKMMTNAARLGWSATKVNRLLAHFRPEALLLTGGYINVPVGLVAWLRRIPMVIYLPDIEPGRAIRFLSRFARVIACSTEASSAYLPAAKLVVTGYPVRPDIRAANAMSKAEALAQFGLVEGRPTLFVFGGSRGARSINRALLAALPSLLAEMQVIHISGTLDWPVVEQAAAELPASVREVYRPYPYLHQEMGAAFRAADLVVARAGASMLGEGPTFALPAILAPYPHAWRYQKVNADYLADRGAAIRLDDDKLAQQLAPTVLGLARDRERLAAMGKAASALDRPDAAERLARVFIGLAQGKRTWSV
jgi:UDP-N-acetylglucosamine--N-acetylmuramyl-(pentapeptide) pyrophosphoryl-undecaprenol N-acetylglucosamine transferase